MKKITYDDITYLRNYKKKHLFEKYCCNWYIEKENNNAYILKCKIKILPYVIMFIPVHILKAFVLMWNGGLREFCIEPITIRDYYVSGLTSDDETTSFGKVRKIYER